MLASKHKTFDLPWVRIPATKKYYSVPYLKRNRSEQVKEPEKTRRLIMQKRSYDRKTFRRRVGNKLAVKHLSTTWCNQ